MSEYFAPGLTRAPDLSQSDLRFLAYAAEVQAGMALNAVTILGTMGFTEEAARSAQDALAAGDRRDELLALASGTTE